MKRPNFANDNSKVLGDSLNPMDSPDSSPERQPFS